MSYTFRIWHWILYGKLVASAREEAERNVRGYCNVLGKGQWLFN